MSRVWKVIVETFCLIFRQIMPDTEALNEMGLNLVRLRDTYNLSVPEMLAGNVSGRVSPLAASGLDVRDCLRIADITHEDLKPNGLQIWHEACEAMPGERYSSLLFGRRLAS